MGDDDVRVALRRHWAASDANDFATEHRIYRADAVLQYPQSGERIRGRANIEASRVVLSGSGSPHPLGRLKWRWGRAFLYLRMGMR
jgi:hypothetical protein